jgi:hypothetical protein
MGEREVPEEIAQAENRLSSESRQKVDEIRNYLHAIATELDELVTKRGEDVLKIHDGSTRLVQARQCINQINQLIGNKERSRFIVDDTLSSIKSLALFRALMDK